MAFSPRRHSGLLELPVPQAEVPAADFVLQAEVLPGLQSTARDPTVDTRWPQRACGITIGYGEDHSSGV